MLSASRPPALRDGMAPPLALRIGTRYTPLAPFGFSVSAPLARHQCVELGTRNGHQRIGLGLGKSVLRLLPVKDV